MANPHIHRRIHPRGTTGRFGVFRVQVFNPVVWPAIDPSWRSELPVVHRPWMAVDYPVSAWIFQNLPAENRRGQISVAEWETENLPRMEGSWRTDLVQTFYRRRLMG